MSDMRQQNDWQQFREHIQRDIDRQATSNKALLWGSIITLGLLIAINMLITVSALLHNATLEQKVINLSKEVATLNVQCTVTYELLTRRNR